MLRPTQTFTVNDGPATDDLVVTAQVRGCKLVKGGVGQMALGGTNSHDGQTSINAGVLKITNAFGLGSFSSSTPDTVVASGATLELAIPAVFGSPTPAIHERLNLSGTGVGNSGALRVSAGGATWAGNITFASDVAISRQGGGLAVSGPIDGPGGLTKLGGSTLELQAANSYAGPTAVNSGTLRFDNVAALGTSTTPIPVAGGATLAAFGTFTVNRGLQLADHA